MFKRYSNTTRIETNTAAKYADRMMSSKDILIQQGLKHIALKNQGHDIVFKRYSNTTRIET